MTALYPSKHTAAVSSVLQANGAADGFAYTDPTDSINLANITITSVSIGAYLGE